MAYSSLRTETKRTEKPMQLVTVKDIARLTGKTENAIRQMIYRGELGEPVVRAKAWDLETIKEKLNIASESDA